MSDAPRDVSKFFDGGSSRSPIAVFAVFDQAVIANLCELLELGPIVSFAVSSDGGTVAATVTHDGEWVRAWFRESTELADWLTDATRAVDARRASASTGSSSRNRGAEGRRRSLERR